MGARSDLTISSNNALNSLQGLDALTSVGGNLGIQSNDTLSSLTALHGLISVDGDTRRVQGNPCLPATERDAFEAATGITLSWASNGGSVGTGACP